MAAKKSAPVRRQLLDHGRQDIHESGPGLPEGRIVLKDYY
jgi:hypothetical protein